MASDPLLHLMSLTCQRDATAVRSFLERLPRAQKGIVFEEYTAALYQGNGWLAVRQGSRGDEGADILLHDPRTPDTVSLIVQCKNRQRPLSFDDARTELRKFEENSSARHGCNQFRLISVSGFVGQTEKLSQFNLLLDGWQHIANLIERYAPDHHAKPEVELHAHNRVTYDEVVSLWRTSSRVAIVQPTGTGKSLVIARAMAEFAGKPAVVLAPSRHILDQLKRRLTWVTNQTTFLTYSKCRLLSPAAMEDLNPSLVVLDEFHRCGAEEWGGGIHRLLACNPQARVLGATATPIRYLDDCRDMAQELFHGNVAGDFRLEQAIVRRILPMPKYVCALYAIDDETDELTARIEHSRFNAVHKRELVGRIAAAKIDWEQSAGIPQVLAKHITDGLNKFIVFCKDKAHLDAMVDRVRGWFQQAFGKPRVDYRVVSGEPDSGAELKRFRCASDKRKVHLMFCIDMLNEGIHIEDVSGVILLRQTESPRVFYQQIGRCIQVGLKHTPIIFDFVNNFQSIQATDFRVVIERANREEGRRREVVGLPERPIGISIFDETRDFVQLLEAIEERISPKALACRRTEEICRRYGSLRNLPKQKRGNPQEAADAAWLGQMKQAKQGKGLRQFYPDLDEIAARHDMAALFDVLTSEQRKQHALDRTHRLCEAIRAGHVNRTMKIWQHNVKRLKMRFVAGHAVVGYYREMDGIVASYGLSNVFDVTDSKEVAQQRVVSLLKWMKNHGRRLPHKNSADAEERRYAIVVSALRMAKQGHGKYLLWPELEALIDGEYPELLDDIKTRKLKRTHEFCRRYQGRRLPSQLSNEPQERRDAKWHVGQRMAKAGRQTSSRHYAEMDEIAESYGMPHLFDYFHNHRDHR
jgi:superfamily II DNA or RNA helicase